MTLPLEQRLATPSESRQDVMEVIRQFGRQANPNLPPQPVPIETILTLENRLDLWFGPGGSGDEGTGQNDALSFLYAQQTLGVVKIDEKNQTVTFTPQT